MPRAESDTQAENTAQVDLLYRDLIGSEEMLAAVFHQSLPARFTGILKSSPSLGNASGC